MDYGCLRNQRYARHFALGVALLTLVVSTCSSESGYADPLLTVTAPTDGSTVSGSVMIAMAVSSAIYRTDLYVDGNYLTSGPPFTTSWDSTSVANGSHTILVNGYSEGGSILPSSSSVTVNVNNEPPTPAPTPTPTPAKTATGASVEAGVGVAGLDQYGGVTNVQCTNGPAPHFYTQKIGDRWWICDPAGNGFFMKGAVGVSYSLPTSIGQIAAKYGSALNPYVVSTAEDSADVWVFNYVIEQVNRLRAWGFNELADGAAAMIWPTNKDVRWNTTDYTIPGQYKMPFNLGANTTRNAFLNQANCNIASPVKDMMSGIGPTYSAWHYNFGDYFDPGFSTCVGNMYNPANNTSLAIALGQSPGAPHGDYLLYLTLDEGDQTGFLDQGPEFSTIDNNGLPDNPVSASAHPSWITLTTAPTQSSANVVGFAETYSDATVYTKQEFSKFMSARYGASITALNLAWGSSYTTFGSAGGWGVGTGLLDENGTCPSRGVNPCWVGDDITLSGETTAMQADMSAFLTDYLDQYFSVMTGWIHTYAPGVMTQMSMGGFGAPPRPEVLEAAGKYLDLPQLTIPPNCPTCTDTQQRMDFAAHNLGDKPWMMWEGFFANPDSAESSHVRSDNMASTQAGRGAVYQQMVTNLTSARDSLTNSYHVVGFYWWAMYDMNNEGLNWGLITPSDNPYDGTSAVIAAGVDQWGYSTGGQANNYGDFLSDVTNANNGILSSMAP